MGANQSSSGGQSQGNGAVSTSYYELLGVDRHADDDEYMDKDHCLYFYELTSLKDKEGLPQKGSRIASRPKLWKGGRSHKTLRRDTERI